MVSPHSVPRDDRQERQRLYAEGFKVHLGVDAAKGHHAIVARGISGGVVEAGKVKVKRPEFDAYLDRLREAFPGVKPSEMLVGIEFAGHHGATLAQYLRDLGFPVHSVLAMSTKRAREAALNSKLKTDLRDARQICTLVRQGVYVRYPFPRPDIVRCKELGMRRHRMGVERARLINRIRGLLDLIWPEFEANFSDLDHVTPRALLQRWPSPAKFVAAGRKGAHFIRKASRGQHDGAWVREFTDLARHSLGLTVGLQEREAELHLTLARWDLLNEQIAATEVELEAAVADCPEATLLRTIPAVSNACAATLVGELAAPADFDHPNQILKLAGLNLTSAQSGNSAGPSRISKRGRPMLRRQLYLLAGRWTQEGMPYREDSLAMKAAGRKGKERCVILARRLVRVVFAVLKTGRPFSLELFEQNRQHRKAA